MNCLILFYSIVPALAFGIPRHIIPDTTPEVQGKAVEALIKRTIGEDAANYFKVSIDRKLDFRSFQLNTTENNKLSIIAWDGVSAAKGFHFYLKYYLKHDITWNKATAVFKLPLKLPNTNIYSKSASAFIYYQNVCTWSYSFAWWNWSKWRQHIDWMAMMGISLTIAPIQEEIWHKVYSQLGLNEEEIQEHFAGPAFQAWQRMGNIRGWGGPLTAVYRRMQYLLQQRIIEGQRELGISVALPAFAGHVPTAMARLYPHINFTAVERWNNFPNKYCCPLFLDPNELLFKEIAAEFLSNVIAAYDTNNIYFSDPFNEIQPRLADANYMQMTAYHIYDSMRSTDSKAIWLLQGWMFVKNIFWTDELIKAFLTAAPLGKMLILDLQSEQFPQYERTHSFHGQPFIWCMLHNFGGTLGMHGSANIVNTHVRLARNMTNTTMIGVGITPEGISQNYVMYALALERAWLHDDMNLNDWFRQFANIRYGLEDERLQESWSLLRESVYAFCGMRKLRGKYTITKRPGFTLYPWIWYNATNIQQAWHLLLDANSSIPANNYDAYEHDLVDITRQFLQIMSDQIYVNLISSYKKEQLERYMYIADTLLKLFNDLEEILATHNDFLLGRWLQSAKDLGETAAESNLYEFNARNQITTWGPNGQILDYATKQWSGIVRDYYKPRWALFLNMTTDSLMQNTRFNNSLFKYIVSTKIENPFSVQLTNYPIVKTGNSFLISFKIYTDWMKLLRTNKFVHYLRLNVKLV